jgi:RHS repeat-associated protein
MVCNQPLRANVTLSFMLGDHLGSTSLMTYENGNVLSETRYTAWGEVRYSSGTMPTKYSYTGQYSYTADFGLMFYNACWYDSYLNHFTQPDSIVPDPYNPQDWNRYSYVRNNPIRYNDPSGHKECSVDSNGGCDKKEELWNYAYSTLERLGGKNDLLAVVRIVNKAARLYGTYEKMMPELSEIFIGVHESNPLTILHAAGAENGCNGVGREPRDCQHNSGSTTFWDTGFNKDFRDGHNQVFHFWAYLATAASTDTSGLPANYLWGSYVAVQGNAFHEIYWPWTDPAGSSWQDYGLGVAGIGIGTLVSMGAVPPTQLGNTIQNYVGINSPGYPFVSALTTVVPLPGNWMKP